MGAYEGSTLGDLVSYLNEYSEYYELCSHEHSQLLEWHKEMKKGEGANGT